MRIHLSFAASSGKLPGYKPPSSRHFSTSAIKRQGLCFIAGAGHDLGPMTTAKAAQAGCTVIGLTSKITEPSSFFHEKTQIHYYPIDMTQMSNPNYIEKTFDAAMKTFNLTAPSHVIGVNLIGAAIPTPDLSLKDINYGIPISFFKGITKTFSDVKKLSLCQVSSIAPVINDLNECEYSFFRNKTDQEVISLQNPSTNVLVLRPSIMFPPISEDGATFVKPAYSLELLGKFPLYPILGSGEQLIHGASQEDIAESIFRFADHEAPFAEIINAVSDNPITQKEWRSLLCKEDRLSLHIPDEVSTFIGLEFPMGKLADYSSHFFKTLDKCPEKNQPICSKRFNELLGKKPVTFSEHYRNLRVVNTKGHPVLDHLQNMAKKMYKNPELLGKFSLTTLQALPKFRISK